jgi:glycerol-3-phosphate acyltransferase PlsY
MGFTALPEESGLFLFGCATAGLVIYAHRGNIRRMLDGTESRFSSPAVRWLRRGQ